MLNKAKKSFLEGKRAREVESQGEGILLWDWQRDETSGSRNRCISEGGTFRHKALHSVFMIKVQKVEEMGQDKDALLPLIPGTKRSGAHRVLQL